MQILRRAPSSPFSLIVCASGRQGRSAALCTEGETVIGNAGVIARGYERIDTRLRALGADIVREK